MKTFLLVIAVVVLLNAVNAKVHQAFGPEPLIFREETVAENLEDVDEDQKENASQKCCHPKSLQGTIHLYQPGSSTPVEIKIYVDADHNRLAMIVGQQRSVIICSSSSCMIISIYERGRLCRKQILHNVCFDDIHDRCVPPKATRLGAVLKLGVDTPGQSSTRVQQWVFSSGSSSVRKLVTVNGCFPVAEIATRKTGPCQETLMNSYFFDIATPVKDPRVFAIPSYCLKAKEVEAARDEEQDLKPFYLRFN